MKHAQLVFRITTAQTVLVFAGSGIGNLLHDPHIAVDMAAMGYPPFFMTVLGVWKMMGAIAVAVPGVPRLKEWAYAGMIFDLTGAAISRAVTGFGPVHVLIPLALCGIVLTSWALRPASRRLPGAARAQLHGWRPVSLSSDALASSSKTRSA